MTQTIFRRRALLRTGAAFPAAAALASWVVGPAMAQGTAQGATQGVAGPLKVGIIGSGNVGATLGTLWAKAGHPVLFSSRHPEELKGLVGGLGPLAHAGTPVEAVAFADVVLVAVPYGAMLQLGRDLAGTLAGKVLLDATNAIPNRNGEVAQKAQREGIGEASASFFPGAHLVRAFNTLATEDVAKAAHRPGAPVAIPLAGDDQGALAAVSVLVRDAGFEPVVVGPLARAKDFAAFTPVFLQLLTAPELRQRLQITP